MNICSYVYIINLLYICQQILLIFFIFGAKLFSCYVKLRKINKIFENTLSLRVAGNGTKKPVTTIVAPAF